MSLLGYLFYFFIVILADVFGLVMGFNISLLYLVMALALLAANAARKWIAGRDGSAFRDSRKAEMLDNSVTKPASFKHEFIYNDCSNKTLLFSELPYLVCIIANLILRWLGILH